jgi:hypothetical protein
MHSPTLRAKGKYSLCIREHAQKEPITLFAQIMSKHVRIRMYLLLKQLFWGVCIKMKKIGVVGEPLWLGGKVME